MKKTQRLLSLFLAVLMAVSVLTAGLVSFSAASASISYSYTKSAPGYAQGTITVTSSDNGSKYYLYWANDKAALEGYRELGVVTISSGKGTLTMPAQTVIPPDATKIIGIKSSSAPSSVTLADASAVYSIPAGRQLSLTSADALYTFGAISDPQLANDSHGSNSYPYDEIHLEAALRTLADRNVDFTISSGDTVNDQNGNQTFAAEYKRYQKILAESDYAKPIYEANGNHDVGTVWNKNGNHYNADKPFVIGTGLDSVAGTINSGKPYFEITEPVTGDHFIFMALEGGFYTDSATQFSAAQLDWLEGLLKKYSTDGKNIFIIEHANIQGWGSGDKLTKPYYYDLGLNRDSADVKRFIKLMETYKECVVISGHTHLELSAQCNYSDNGGTSSVIMHNSAIGGVRRLVNDSVDRTPVKGLSEGYIVEVYKDFILFNGINMYSNEIMPLCCYIIPFDTEALDAPEDTTAQETTQKPVVPTVSVPTEVSTATDATEATTIETTPATSDTTEPSASVTDETESTTESIIPTGTTPEVYLMGDADMNGKVNVKDATTVQKHAASLLTLNGKAFELANVSGDKAVNVRDATAIQKYVAGIITVFPAQGKGDTAAVGALAPEFASAKEKLEKYYMYSSYDQYMELKYFYRYGYLENPEVNRVERFASLEKNLEDLILAIGGSLDVDVPVGEITVYFTNNYNWSSVRAYVWGSAGKIADWPGTAMTYVTTNGQNQKIYAVTFSYEDYQKIIFTDGSKQTVDIDLEGKDGVGYYISGESGGKYTCSTYAFIM